MKRLSLTIDYAFKKFFVDNRDLLIDFLNAIFQNYDRFQIESLTIQNPQLPGPTADDKNAVLDIVAKDWEGRLINIEMQAREFAGFVKRSVFYAFRLYVQSIEKGEKHVDIPPVYSINLLDFDLFPGLPYHRLFRLSDVNDPSVSMMEEIEFHFIELKKLKTSIAQLQTPLESWMTFIGRSRELTEEEIKELEARNPVMKKAHKALDEISMDPDARLWHDRRQAAIFFDKLAIAESKAKGREEGRAEGREEGREEGRAEGRAEGREAGNAEGRAEGLREGEIKGRLETARRMRKKGVDLATIIEFTELSAEELLVNGIE